MASQPYELPNVMSITKSSNRNEVHYAASVDDRCVPVTQAPLRAYWQMRERGPNVTEPLTARERSVLGVESQTVSGDSIRFALGATASRVFVARVGRAADGTCTSSVVTTIAGTQARLVGVHVKQTFFGGVDYVQLTGRTPDGKTVNERMRP